MQEAEFFCPQMSFLFPNGRNPNQTPSSPRHCSPPGPIRIRSPLSRSWQCVASVSLARSGKPGVFEIPVHDLQAASPNPQPQLGPLALGCCQRQSWGTAGTLARLPALGPPLSWPCPTCSDPWSETGELEGVLRSGLFSKICSA